MLCACGCCCCCLLPRKLLICIGNRRFCCHSIGLLLIITTIIIAICTQWIQYWLYYPPYTIAHSIPVLSLLLLIKFSFFSSFFEYFIFIIYEIKIKERKFSSLFVSRRKRIVLLFCDRSNRIEFE